MKKKALILVEILSLSFFIFRHALTRTCTQCNKYAYYLC